MHLISLNTLIKKQQRIKKSQRKEDSTYQWNAAKACQEPPLD
jgi:hypothetical protein